MKHPNIIAIPVCSVLVLLSGTLMAQTALSWQYNGGLRVDGSVEYRVSNQGNAGLRARVEGPLAGRATEEDTWKFRLLRLNALDRQWNINLQYRASHAPGNFRLHRPQRRQLSLAAEFSF